MLKGWELPTSACIGGKIYPIHTDFRDILEIFSYLNDTQLPEFIRWHVALALFYDGNIPQAYAREAMEYLASFLRCGEEDTGAPAPKLLDWEQDAGLIIADINKVAGQEIRAAAYIHWWTFLSWFHAIGEGQLSTVVSIRDKLRRGKKLEPWEREFYREHKQQVDMKKRYTPEELAQQERLKAMLDGKKEKIAI